MKNFILNFKAGIRFFTSIIISREFAVIYCLMGTISQISHTYFLIESISSLDGYWRVFQASVLSIFISSSLFYFVAIADNEDKSENGIKDYKHVLLAINLFTFMEIVINIYYYTRHLLIDQKEYQVLDYVFAILVSCLIPVTLKLYSSSIRAKEWIISIEHDKSALVDGIESEEISEDKLSLMKEEILSLIDERLDLITNSISTNNDEHVINTELEEKINLLTEEISKIKNIDTDSILKEVEEKINRTYQTQSQLFLNQFENKIKTMQNNVLQK